MALQEQVNIQSRPLSGQQEAWLQQAWANLNEERLAQLLTNMVNISAPTGREGPLARYCVQQMQQAGFKAYYQPMLSGDRGNAVGVVKGAGGGADLLFYGHLDHYFSETEDDLLVTGGADDPLLHPIAIREGRAIRGAGAGNMRSACATAMLAAEAVLKAQAGLQGSVTVALVSGGVHKVENSLSARPYLGFQYDGQGSGVHHLLGHGVRADFAVNTKGSPAVYWEDPGVLWVKFTVRGVVGYVSRRGTYADPILAVGPIISELADWFEQYADAHTAGQVATPGHIGAIEGGWPFKPDFSPATCNLYLDIRLNPRDDIQGVKAEFQAFVDRLQARHPEVTLEWEPYSIVPSNRTDPNNWVVQTCVRAWERVEDRPHVVGTSQSGMTDGTVLRAAGIPTARFGNWGGRGPSGADGRRDPSKGFLAADRGADLDEFMQLARCYIYTIIDTCTRPRAEVLGGK